MKTKQGIEVQSVANGWMVMPARGMIDNSGRDFNDIYIFETFDHLIEWLRDHFEMIEKA